MQHSGNIAIIVYKILLVLLLFTKALKNVNGAMTISQMEKTMETMRSICGPKYNLKDELIDGLKKGEFVENKDLKCYTMCVAQMAGTLSKKNEINYQKTLSQIQNLLPTELRELSVKILDACRNVQKEYKEPCDRTFYTTKCMYEYAPDKFLFP